ncbi:unnamed protein product [Cunninghamella echinulata]
MLFNNVTSINLLAWCKKKLQKIIPKSTSKINTSMEEKYHHASSLSYSSSIVFERDVRQLNSPSPPPWIFRTGFSPNPDSYIIYKIYDHVYYFS